MSYNIDEIDRRLKSLQDTLGVELNIEAKRLESQISRALLDECNKEMDNSEREAKAGNTDNALIRAWLAKEYRKQWQDWPH